MYVVAGIPWVVVDWGTVPRRPNARASQALARRILASHKDGKWASADGRQDPGHLPTIHPMSQTRKIRHGVHATRIEVKAYVMIAEAIGISGVIWVVGLWIVTLSAAIRRIGIETLAPSKIGGCVKSVKASLVIRNL